jgi:hypothetical protein
MTLRQIAWFLGAYVALVALAIWFNLAILCQGDVKYSGGCGGFEIYIPLWEIFLLPLPIAVMVLELWRKTTPPSTRRLLAYLVGIITVEEVGFLFIERFPHLIAIEAAAIAFAAIWRWRSLRSSDAPAAVA